MKVVFVFFSWEFLSALPNPVDKSDQTRVFSRDLHASGDFIQTDFLQQNFEKQEIS